MPPPATLAERVRAARTAAGLSQQELARRTGIRQPSLAAIEAGETRRPRFLMDLARALGVTPEWLERGETRPPATAAAAGPSAAALPPGAQPLTPGSRDLPVYAAAEGGAGELILTYDAVEWVVRPAPLVGVPGAFAMYVTGESMQPVYRPGDILLVHPARPPRADDDVLIVFRDHDSASHRAMVKRLIRVAPDQLHLRQFNPPPGATAEFTVPRNQVDQLCLVVGSYRGL